MIRLIQTNHYLCIIKYKIHLKFLDMKKITLALFMTSVIGFAQTNQQYLVGSADPYNGFLGIEDACSQEFEPYNQLILANAVTDHGPFAVANDFMVDGNSSFEITDISFLLLPLAGNPADISAATIRVYEDSGMAPGSGLTDSNLVAAGNTPHPDTFAGYTMWYMDYELDTPITVTNSDPDPKRYWIGLTVTSGSAQHVYWVGFFWGEDMGSYHYNYQSQAGLDGIYDPITYEDYPGEFFDSEWAVYGDCAPLSIGEFSLENVSIYPNPAVDIVNVNVPAGVEIQNVSVFNILGKNTGISFVNGTLNMSQLQSGIYLISIETNQGTVTQKVVKK